MSTVTAARLLPRPASGPNLGSWGLSVDIRASNGTFHKEYLSIWPQTDGRGLDVLCGQTPTELPPQLVISVERKSILPVGLYTLRTSSMCNRCPAPRVTSRRLREFSSCCDEVQVPWWPEKRPTSHEPAATRPNHGGLELPAALPLISRRP